MKTIVQWTISSAGKASNLYSKPFRMGEHDWKLNIQPYRYDGTRVGLYLYLVSPPKLDIDLSNTLFITSYNQKKPESIKYLKASYCFKANIPVGWGWLTIINLREITTESFTVGVISPTPTLEGQRVDPTILGNDAIRVASANGHTKVVKLLLDCPTDLLEK